MVYPVAVGMAVASHPPHRTVLAALPHTVLTSDAPLWAASKTVRKAWKLTLRFVLTRSFAHTMQPLVHPFQTPR